MHKLTLYYSVRNGGDGSAYPEFFESMKLAEIDQEFMDEGWAEECTGSITVESESPIRVVESLTTKEQMIAEAEEALKNSWATDLDRKKLAALKKLK